MRAPRRAIDSGWRKLFAQTDTGQNVCHHRHTFSYDGSAASCGDGIRLLRRDIYREAAWPGATVEAVRMGKKKMFASSAKAERELGFQIVPVYSALRAAIDWFRAHG